jgi:hypothetical protein
VPVATLDGQFFLFLGLSHGAQTVCNTRRIGDDQGWSRISLCLADSLPEFRGFFGFEKLILIDN